MSEVRTNIPIQVATFRVAPPGKSYASQVLTNGFCGDKMMNPILGTCCPPKGSPWITPPLLATEQSAFRYAAVGTNGMCTGSHNHEPSQRRSPITSALTPQQPGIMIDVRS